MITKSSMRVTKPNPATHDTPSLPLLSFLRPGKTLPYEPERVFIGATGESNPNRPRSGARQAAQPTES